MISLIIAIIALSISLASFYYIHLQGPKIKVEHFTHEILKGNLLPAPNPYLEARHTLVVTNNGNKIGLLRNVVVKTEKEISSDDLRQSYLRISHGEDYVTTVAPVPIKAKESIVIIFDYILQHPRAKHYIEVSYDTSFFLDIKQKTEKIWNSEKFGNII